MMVKKQSLEESQDAKIEEQVAAASAQIEAKINPPEEKEDVKSEEVKPETAVPPMKSTSFQGVDLWITDDSKIGVTVYVYFDKNKKVVLISGDPLIEEKAAEIGLTVGEIYAEFLAPQKKDLDLYRERASKWNADAEAMMISRGRVRQQLIKFNLKKLIVLGEDQKLTFDKKALDFTSQKLVEKLHPTVIELLLYKFEKEAAIVVV